MTINRKAKQKTPENELSEKEIKSKINSASKSKAPAAAAKTGSDRNRMIFVIVGVLASIVGSRYYNQYMANLVNKPLNEPKIIDESFYNQEENLDRYWGTYRSNLYFGLKTRSPNPFMVGMMWFNQFSHNFEMR